MHKKTKTSLLFSILTLLLAPMVYQGARALNTAIPAVDGDKAWTEQAVDGTGTKIAIIDTGIDWMHPDFYHVQELQINPGGIWPNPTIGAAPPADFVYVDLNFNMVPDPGEGPLKILDVGFINNSGNIYGNDGEFNSDVDYIYVDDAPTDNEWNYDTEPIFYTNGDTGPVLLPQIVNHILYNISKIDLIWDQTNDNLYQRGVNLTNSSINTMRDNDGHGTHVAGIAAGGIQGKRRYVGIAPGADLLVCKVANWSDESVAAGIDWAVDNGADVVSLSFGLFFKNWTLDGAAYGEGGSLSEAAIERAWNENVPVVVAAGNNADKDCHSKFNADLSSTTFNNLILPSEPLLHQLALTFLWREPYADVNFMLRDPGGLSIGPINATINATGEWHVFPKNATHWYHYYLSYMNNNSRGTRKAYMYVLVNSNPLPNATTIGIPLDPGVWIIEHENTSPQNQTIEEYVYSATGDDSHYSGRPGAFFQASTGEMTVSSPATADHAIVASSFITTHPTPALIGNISVFSSRGQRIDGKNFTMVSAPGESITSACSRSVGGSSGNYTTKRGTSQATPLIAGAIALALQKNSDLKYNLTHLVTCLLNSTVRDSNVTSWGSIPNVAFGYGKLNVTAFVSRSSSFVLVGSPPTSVVLSVNSSTPTVSQDYLISWSSNGGNSYVLYENTTEILTESGTFTSSWTGLTNNSMTIQKATTGTWWYAIVAVNASGRTISSSVNVTVQASVPSEPEPGPFIISSPDAGDPDDDGIFTLVWNSSQYAANYSIYVHATPIEEINGSLTKVAEGLTNNSIQIKNQVNGTWFYVMVASNAMGNTTSNVLAIDIEISSYIPTEIAGYNSSLMGLCVISAVISLISILKKKARIQRS